MVILTKTGRKNSSADLELDLSKPYDFIKYKIALVSPRVLNDWATRENAGKSFEFVIIDEGAKFEEELAYSKQEDAVLEYLLTNKNSKRKLFDLLRMYGVENANKQVTYDSSVDWLYQELKKASRRPSEVKKLYTLIQLGTKDISDKVFLQDCITVGLIEKRGLYEYRLSGGSKIANNEAEALAWLNDKRHQSTKARFEAAIEDYYSKNN